MFFKKFFKIIAYIAVISNSCSLMAMCCRRQRVIPAVAAAPAVAAVVAVAGAAMGMARDEAVKIAEIIHASRAAALRVPPSGSASDVSEA